MPFPRTLVRLTSKFFSAIIRTPRSVVGIPGKRMTAICCGVSHTSLIDLLRCAYDVHAMQWPDVHLDVAIRRVDNRKAHAR